MEAETTMRLQLSTWKEVEAYLTRCNGILIPIGSTEQHGPNGLIGTDAICPETIAFAASKQEDILVGPTLNIGMAQHHLSFPGSITLKPSTLIRVVCDVVQSLHIQGFQRIMFYNGHGGNIATMNAAFSEIYSELSLSGVASLPDLKCTLVNWFEGPRTRSLAFQMFGDAEGSHATPSEVSLSWFAYPEAEKRVEMSPPIAPSHAFTHSQDMRNKHPDGRCGSNPLLASVQYGERILETSILCLLDSWRGFLKC